jgi:hypothetical protein
MAHETVIEDGNTHIVSGKLKGEKTSYKDGVGVCIFEENGICLDFAYDEIDNLMEILVALKATEPNIYVESEESKKADEEWKRKEKTLRYKLYWMLKNIGVRVAPFDWRLEFGRDSFITTPNVHKKFGLTLNWCSGGIHVGPLIITW